MKNKKRFVAILDTNQVTPLKELAEILAANHGWRSYRVLGKSVYFTAGFDKDLVNGKIYLSGFAYDAKTGAPLEDQNVLWDEEFDGWSNYVWAEDVDGNTVMLHD